MVSLFRFEKTASRSTPKTKHDDRDGIGGLKRQGCSINTIKSKSRLFYALKCDLIVVIANSNFCSTNTSGIKGQRCDQCKCIWVSILLYSTRCNWIGVEQNMHLRWRYKIIPSKNEVEGVHLKAGNSNRIKKNLLKTYLRIFQHPKTEKQFCTNIICSWSSLPATFKWKLKL